MLSLVVSRAVCAVELLKMRQFIIRIFNSK